MKTDPERSDYIGTSDAFAFECRLNGVSLESARERAVKAETGRADFREHLSFSLFNLSRSFSLSVSSRFTDRSYYYHYYYHYDNNS